MYYLMLWNQHKETVKLDELNFFYVQPDHLILNTSILYEINGEKERKSCEFIYINRKMFQDKTITTVDSSRATSNLQKE